jgi:hypothetical protein
MSTERAVPLAKITLSNAASEPPRNLTVSVSAPTVRVKVTADPAKLPL